MTPRKIYLSLLILILVAQGLDLIYLRARFNGEASFSLQSVPTKLGEWEMRQEARFDEQILGALDPSDYFVRYYGRSGDPRSVELMIAYFRSQAEGFGPHSPQVCLPASGWQPISHQRIYLADDAGGTFPANRYLLQNGREYSLVLYWYHSRSRATAGEMEARFWMSWDTIATGENEISLVRAIMPLSSPDEPVAEEILRAFASNVYSNLRRSWGPS
jgi:EpsI family protein